METTPKPHPLALTSYRPSNGSEGCYFAELFCDQCAHEKQTHTGDDNDRACEIIMLSMCFDQNDPEYPKEWIYDNDGHPTCTKFKRHVWRDSYTGDLIDYELPEPLDPAQLDIFQNL